MKTRFQDLVEEASHPQRVVKISTGGLFVGLSTASDIWGQKQQKYKPEEEDAEWTSEDSLEPDEGLSPPEPEEPNVVEDLPDEILIDEDQIIAELNLRDNMNVRELQAVRRAFARRNHPDAVSQNRLACEDRMKIANRIIDEHIRSRSHP